MVKLTGQQNYASVLRYRVEKRKTLLCRALCRWLTVEPEG